MSSKAINNLAEPTDEQLAADARAGSVASFDQLVRRHQARLVRFIARYVSNRSDIEDVLQNAFIRAYENLPKYDPSRKFMPWLLTIAYRGAISHYRAHRREKSFREIDDDVQHAQPAQFQIDEPETNLWTIARRVLSEDQFSALWMFYVEEMTGGEIAKVLDRSWVAVKVMLHRARTRLREHLGESYVEQGMTSESR